MKSRVVEFIEAIRTSFWFLPGLMTVAATAAAFAAVYIDNILKSKVAEKIGVLYGGGPEGAREVLAATAGSSLLACIRGTAPHVKRAEDREILIEETRRTLAVSAKWEDRWARHLVEEQAQDVLASLRGETS